MIAPRHILEVSGARPVPAGLPRLAAIILRGIERNSFLVHTSFDVRFGYWWARKFAWPYEIVMRRANAVFNSIYERGGRGDAR